MPGIGSEAVAAGNGVGATFNVLQLAAEADRQRRRQGQSGGRGREQQEGCKPSRGNMSTMLQGQKNYH